MGGNLKPVGKEDLERKLILRANDKKDPDIYTSGAEHFKQGKQLV